MVRYTSRIGKAAPVIKKVVKKVVAAKKARVAARAKPVVDDLPAADEDPVDFGGALSTGGVLQTGGALPSIDKLGYPAMIHTLGAMDQPTFHILQGMASTFLPQVIHPLKKPFQSAMGGALVHPPGISKVATMDIVKAPTPQQLAMALHGEWLDSMKGRAVGGGLFDSLKSVIKKGISVVSKGAMKALQVGTKLRGALQKGTAIAKSFEGPLTAAVPAAGELLSRGIKGAEALDVGLGIGLAAGEKISAGLEDVSAAVNPEAQ